MNSSPCPGRVCIGPGVLLQGKATAIKGVAINMASGSDIVTAEGEENVQFPSILRR